MGWFAPHIVAIIRGGSVMTFTPEQLPDPATWDGNLYAWSDGVITWREDR